MRTLMVLAALAALVFGVTVALKSTLAPARYSLKDSGVVGALGVGAVSRLQREVQVWREPRGSISRGDREALLVTVLAEGDTFRVLNHLTGEVLWVEIEGVDDPTVRGWLRSPPDDPVMASKVR